jgi:hypothetical protein
MAGVVNTVTLSLGASSGFGASPSAASNAPAVTVASAAAVRNPQIIQDPVAGFITQYVNMNSGQIISQAPSAIAVAYLRQGLSASGMPTDTAIPPKSVATTA